ncbi:MAG TPA: DUF2252 domain-containing protein [Acidimicrobiia bacterium]|nr:DUF2252 domain-containing protein [Acidimicrobiia bacterium]
MSRGRFIADWRRARLTVDERVARGKAARDAVPRATYGAWQPDADRPDPVALLEEQAEHRVPELVPIRYGRMLVSPFTFFRGAALIMASDLASTPRSNFTVQLCGDAHMSNFGLFASPERRLVFDINDFDETLPGPWEWDVKRLAASFEVCGRDRAFAEADRRAITTAAVREYRKTMRQAAKMGSLEAWYDHLEVGALLEAVEAELRPKEARAAQRDIATARTRDSVRVLTKRVDNVDGDLRIRAEPPLIVPLEDLAASDIPDWEVFEPTIKKLLASYVKTLSHHHHPLEEFRYVHAARKVVGVGSVGTRCYILLLVGRDNDDPLILQVKEAGPSVLERFLGPSEYENHGERVVAGQRLMQSASDIFLGWQRIKGVADGVPRDYYLRQLHDWKGSFDSERLGVAGITLYARLCGATLARAHARWGDRIAIAWYLGKGDGFDDAVADFASAYADQNEADYEAFVAATSSGRLPIEAGL